MGMTITTRAVGEDGYQKNYYEWYKGNAFPAIPENEDVVSVGADGVELACVRQEFRNIPEVYSHTYCIWEQPFAQFIVDNMMRGQK
jgi:hypothetical protein